METKDKKEKGGLVLALNNEISQELKDPAVGRALLATTFKGLQENSMRQAILEGMIRGFKFKDFLEKNVYAIPYGSGYSLVTSIDYARKIGMRCGVVGKSAPLFTYEDEGRPESCTITIKRRVGQDIGEYTATVYFDEFSTGKNLWASKPRVMLAKTAEMHALRMACPEEMSQLYTQEEFDKEKEEEYDTEDITDDTVPTVHVGDDHGESKPSLTIDRVRAEEQEIPEDETTRKNLVLAKLRVKFPELDMKDAKAVKTQIADYTELEFTPVNYTALIKKLS